MNKPAKIDEPALTDISIEELDRRFDAGEDVSPYFDWSKATIGGLQKQSVTLDLPGWIVQGLDREAQKRDVTRQVLIRMWLADRIETTIKP